MVPPTEVPPTEVPPAGKGRPSQALASPGGVVYSSGQSHEVEKGVLVVAALHQILGAQLPIGQAQAGFKLQVAPSRRKEVLGW